MKQLHPITPADVRKAIEVEKAWAEHQNPDASFDAHADEAIAILRPVNVIEFAARVQRKAA